MPDSAEGISIAVKKLQPMITRLQLSRVKLATQRQYFIALVQLLRWLVEDRLVTRSREQWYALLTSRIQCLWEDGAPRALAQRILQALVWVVPGLKGKMAASFPGTAAALAGWTREEPGMSKPPIPLVVQRALSMDILEHTNPIASLALTFLFETYFRVSEGLATTADSVIPAAPSMAGASQSVAILALTVRHGNDGQDRRNVPVGAPRLSVPKKLGLVLKLLAATKRGEVPSDWRGFA